MASVVLTGDTSGQVTLSAPAIAGTNTVTFPAATGTTELIGVGTAVASTSGTAIDFTSIPSWAKRITVTFVGVSTTGTSNYLVQIGTGSTPTYTTSGYSGTTGTGAGATTIALTSGFLVTAAVTAAQFISGVTTLINQSGNNWVAFGISADSVGQRNSNLAGSVALGAALTAIRITTVTGTDTFDAGSVNIMWEG